VNINRCTLRGTCLHEAALCGKTDVVRLLLDVSLHNVLSSFKVKFNIAKPNTNIKVIYKSLIITN